MQNRFCAIIVLATVLLVSGCTSGPSIKKISREIEGFELPAKPVGNRAMVYVVRPGTDGFLVKFDVYVDKKDDDHYVGKTGSSEYIYFEVEPNDCLIISQAENKAKLALKVENDGIYFLKQIAKKGLLFSRNKLVQIPENEGKYWVKKLSKGSML